MGHQGDKCKGGDEAAEPARVALAICVTLGNSRSLSLPFLIYNTHLVMFQVCSDPMFSGYMVFFFH